MATRYGSIDRKFVPLDSDDYVEVPDGIAHFLEHKLFDRVMWMPMIYFPN